MKLALLIIVAIHGLIHILGFLKAFGISEIKELTLPISKSFGLIWLLCVVLFFIYALSIFYNYKFSWIIGLSAVLISQFIIIYFWKDAKFGTIPNIIILLYVLFSFGLYNFNKIIKDETNQIISNVSLDHIKTIEESDLINLPYVIQTWLKNTGIIGKPEIQIGYVKQKAEIKMKPDQKDWYSAEAEQYTTTNPPAFIWNVSLNMMPFINVNGRDKFIDGNGEMLIKINSLINIVNETGEKLNEGTIQRFLGELVWFPSLSLSPFINWETVDELSAKATINYKGTSGSGTFYFNKNGDFEKFIALRFNGNQPDSKRYPWVLTVEDYKVFQGIKVPSKMKAAWELEDSNWTWLNLEIIDLKYNTKN